MSIENQGRDNNSILGTPEIARAYHSRMRELLKMTPGQYNELQRGFARWSNAHLNTNLPVPDSIFLDRSWGSRIRDFFGFLSTPAENPDSR